jgi:hypothetical protein
MAAWRFLLFDPQTRLPLAELPTIGDVSFSEELNDVGAFECKIEMEQPTNSPITLAAITPPRAVFGAERDGVMIYAGFIWTHDYDDDSGLITLAGGDYLSYLNRRVLRTTNNYSFVRQELIAWDLINYAQTYHATWAPIPGFFLGIVNRSRPSVTLRERTYYWYERKNIGEAVRQLAGVRGGFDFRLTPRWLAGPNSELAIDFFALSPPVGRQTDIVLEAGSQINVPGGTLDGTEMAYHVETVGRGEGESTPIAGWNNTTLILGNLPLDKVIQMSDVEHLDTLDDHAHTELQRAKWPIRLPHVQTTDAALLNELIIGDQVRYVAGRGITAIDAVYRSVSQTVTISEDGSERMEIIVAPLELFDAD